MAGTISFFLTGPNDTVQEKIDKIVKEHETLNPKHKAFVKIINSTTEGCASGTTQHTYSLDLIHVDDLKDEK
ncbi:hypothetical protein ABNX05_04940 [Lysinibacillus sp. M3]|uniref:Uncharacterized protein n=1 Tax=Lysinibacillus zambalensis TaxID=3160866 RepID=A0ABV1MQQ6_9BACI